LSLISNAGRVHPISLAESLDAGTKAEIDISSMHLPTGIYLLKVQSDSASEILKVLLAK
jgi:S-ribosylhomocysteine lyase LuxS involved in autoinducer biosynthesis